MSEHYYKVFEATVRGDDLCLARIRANRGRQVFRWPDGTKQTALEIACRHGYKDCLRILLESHPISEMKSESKNDAVVKAIEFCCAAGRAECLEILLNAGANPDVILSGDAKGGPLHVVASRGHVNCCGILLRHSATVDLRTTNGATPLHRAAQHLRLAVIRLLIACGANPAAQTKDAVSPLHLVSLGRGGFSPGNHPVACMSILLACSSVDVNAMTSNGFCPLHFACIGDNVAGAHMLLDFGANCRRKSEKDSKLPIQYIEDINNEEEEEEEEEEEDAENVVKAMLIKGLRARLEAEYKGAFSSHSPISSRLHSKKNGYSINLTFGSLCFCLGCVRPLFLLCKVYVKRMLGFRWQEKLDDLDVPTNVKRALKRT